MAKSGSKDIIDLKEIINQYLTLPANPKQIAVQPNLESMKLKVRDITWKEEKGVPMTSRPETDDSVWVTKGQVKGFNKELSITPPKELSVKEIKFNPSLEKTENKVKVTNASCKSFTGTLRVELNGPVIFQDGSTKVTEIEFAQIVADVLQSKSSFPLSVIKDNQGLPKCVEWTMEINVKIQ